VERRHDQRVSTEGETREEELWMETVSRYHAKERTSLLWEKLRYHEALIQSHSSTFELLIGRHRNEVERIERLLGITSEAIEKGAAA
jgi:hypothetical protein